MLSTKLLQNLLLVGVGLVLVLAVVWAFVAGSRAAKSTAILHDTAALQKGFQYFLADQNRYPTAVEFQDKNIMLNYFSSFPPQTITGGPCNQTYTYTSATAKTFELTFCLPKAKSSFIAGWNKIKQP